MRKFHPGNVIKTKEGSIEIVYKVNDDGYTSTIFFDMENASAGHRYKSYEEELWCDCGELDCENCRTNSPYMVTRHGIEDAELLAPTVKKWIIQSLLKGFDFGR